MVPPSMFLLCVLGLSRSGVFALQAHVIRAIGMIGGSDCYFGMVLATDVEAQASLDITL